MGVLTDYKGNGGSSKRRPLANATRIDISTLRRRKMWLPQYRIDCNDFLISSTSAIDQSIALTFGACIPSDRLSDTEEILDQFRFQRIPSQSMSFPLVACSHHSCARKLQSYQSRTLLRNGREICLSIAKSFCCFDGSMMLGNAIGATGLHRLCRIWGQDRVEGGRAEHAPLRCSRLLRESSQEKLVP